MYISDGCDQIKQNCYIFPLSLDPDGCTNGDVRLTGGQSDREGDVQVCRDGKWGYVCSDTWNDVNAKTVCKQLQLSDTCMSMLLKLKSSACKYFLSIKVLGFVVLQHYVYVFIV